MSIASGARRERAEEIDSAAHYDRYVVPFTVPYTEALMPALGGAHLRRVLDHGAGTGTLTRRILSTFPGAYVTALDPSQTMLSRLRGQIAERDRGRVDIRTGTAADLVTTDGFDAVVSQLAFMFVADPETDLLLLRGHVSAGARLAMSVLGGRGDVAAFDLFWSAARRLDHGFAEPDEYPHFRFGDPATLIHAIRSTGWGEVECSRISSAHEVDLDELWEWLSGAMSVRYRGTAEVATIEGKTRQRLRAALRQAAEQFSIGQGRVRLPMHGWCLRATAA